MDWGFLLMEKAGLALNEKFISKINDEVNKRLEKINKSIQEIIDL